MMAPGDLEFTKCVSNVFTWSFSSSTNTALACTLSLYYATSCQLSVTLHLSIIYCTYNAYNSYPVVLELDFCREVILHC